MHGVRASLGALVLFPTWWHVHQHLHRATQPRRTHVSNNITSPLDRGISPFRSGFDDHLADIANLTTYQNGQADLRAWKRRVDFLAAQPGITDIRVEMPGSEVITYSNGHLRWNTMNMDTYGAAFDYTRKRHLNIILIAMPPLRKAHMSNAQYRAVIYSYYDEVGRFAKAHHITDININELGAHDFETGKLITNFTSSYLKSAVSLVIAAFHASRKYVPRVQIIVSESAAMTREATKRLLAVFAALKVADVPCVRGLNIYAGGPVEIGEIGALVGEVRKYGVVWVTEFGVASAGVESEASQVVKLGEIFGAIVKTGVKRVIGYEEMDEPRLQKLANISLAEKHYGILWRADGSMKPAAHVFLSIARHGIGSRRSA
jgi:hypothetical protein